MLVVIIDSVSCFYAELNYLNANNMVGSFQSPLLTSELNYIKGNNQH
jgi:hypothetical protein